jgi:hypothetical protein
MGRLSQTQLVAHDGPASGRRHEAAHADWRTPPRARFQAQPRVRGACVSCVSAREPVRDVSAPIEDAEGVPRRGR